MNRAHRTTVMSPRTRLARRRRRPAPGGAGRLTGPDRSRARAVYAAQRAPAIITLGVLLLFLFGTAFVVWIAPALGEIRFWGVPVSWLLVGVLPFPVLVLLAWGQLRMAEKVENSP